VISWSFAAKPCARGSFWAGAALALALLSACGGGGGSRQSGSVGNEGATTTAATKIEFLLAEPDLIYLEGTPGPSRSLLSFKVLDGQNRPVANALVRLSLPNDASGARLEGTASGAESLSLRSDADGVVQVAVRPGSVPTALRVFANVEGTGLGTSSLDLRVAVGRPAQRALSLAVEKLSIEGFHVDGEETSLTLSLADRVGNPVPDGTQVSFVASSGVLIPPTCVVAGGGSRCSVVLRSQGTRPLSGRVRVLAYTPGEEDFTDLNGNNRWDSAEPFTDLGQAFRDDNHSNAYDAGEFFVPRAGTGACVGDPLSPALASSLRGRPDTCDGTWGEADVRDQAVVVFATSAATISLDSAAPSPGTGQFRVRIADGNGNSMPVGTRLEAAVINTGTTCSVQITPDTVPNTLNALVATVTYADCVAGDGLGVSVVTPRQHKTGPVAFNVR